MAATADVIKQPRVSTRKKQLLYGAAVPTLMLVLAGELVIPARRQSMAFDEGCHAFAGYSYWTRADFGINPEHPPLIKLMASLPLLKARVSYPSLPPIFFKATCYAGARQFFYSGNDVDSMLFRSRMMAAMLTMALALVVFTAAHAMFGRPVALVALLLLVFEPNLIAHGSFVTTDVGVSLFLFLTVYAFYRHIQNPSIWRLALTAVCAGLALAAKHSGIVWIPVLCLLAIVEIIRNDPRSPLGAGGRWQSLLRLAGSLVLVGLISFAILWSFYGFRYQARPQGQVLVPSLPNYAAEIKQPWQAKSILFAAHHHLLPESYLMGLVDVMVFPTNYMRFYLFGRIYRHTTWFYFPAAFAIKSTLGFLLLLLLLPAALLASKKSRKDPVADSSVGRWREILVLAILPVVYFLMAARSGFNIGVRHILPAYPFLVVLAAYTAWRFARRGLIWRSAVTLLVAAHCLSSAHTFPNYLPYANELWGGPSHTYRYLSDSNVDWAQQLKSTKKYLDEHGIKDCWFDYQGRGLVADPSYYRIPCRPLQDAVDFVSAGSVPPHISGTVLISAMEVAGPVWGPGELNPYAQFQHLQPDALIDEGIFVFHGEFDIPLGAAAAHDAAAEQILFQPKPSAAQLNQALAEAQAAVSLAPNDAKSEAVLAEALSTLNQKEEARAANQRALTLAETIQPEFQDQLLESIKQAMQ